MTSARPLVAAMDDAGYRLTLPRRTVAELVAARDGHFTANDLIEDAKVRDLGIGRATIFRALDLFTELEVLERIDLPSGDHAYVPCQPQGHHHHIVCQRCGAATDVEDLGLGAAIEEIQRRTGWQVQTHRLELYGRCPDCGEGLSPQAGPGVRLRDTTYHLADESALPARAPARRRGLAGGRRRGAS
ncbi:MAG: Fur family transcriptional regulator [Candidatus Limnocylindrales bacterium]